MTAISAEQIEAIQVEQVARAKETEKALKKLPNLVIPYPDAASLPWGVRSIVSPVGCRDQYGGKWRIGNACKKRSGMSVIASASIEADGEIWYHVSCARTDKTPSYNDLAWVKEIWFGDLWAIQCFVPQAEHVNIHARCLHLWHCLTASSPFPAFDAGLGSI